jgi:adenylate kinase
MLNLILFGPPGAGKGTQSQNIIEKYKLSHLSTGDIFRANIKGGTELGLLAKSYIDKGQLVPDEVTIGMLQSEVERQPGAKGFIFDGFPRTAAQAQALDKFLASKGSGVSVLISLEVAEDELKRRLLERGKTSGRADDVDPVVIQKRIEVYKSETTPVKEYYAKQGKTAEIEGIGEIDVIFKAICSKIEAVA